jgi:hypothetical protein
MGVSWQCNRWVRPTTSQPRCRRDACGSIFGVRSGPETPNVESFFVAAASSRPYSAPTKTVSVIREEQASFCHVFNPRPGLVTSVGAMVATRIEFAND